MVLDSHDPDTGEGVCLVQLMYPKGSRLEPRERRQLFLEKVSPASGYHAILSDPTLRITILNAGLTFLQRFPPTDTNSILMFQVVQSLSW